MLKSKNNFFNRSRECLFSVLFLSILLFAQSANGAVIVRTPRVSTPVEPTRIFNQDCRTEFFGCMDQFCNLGNADGGSCLCSDEHQRQADRLTRINEINAEAERIRNIDIEIIRAGARADIIFGDGTRQYDARGNVISLNERNAPTAQERRNLRRFELERLIMTEFVPFTDGLHDISTKSGDALQLAVRDICRARVPAECAPDMNMLIQLYSTQVRDDCIGYTLAVDILQRDADQNMTDANAETRMARLDTFERENRLNRGQCLIEFKECMAGPQVCRPDWSDCVDFAAADNMVAPTPARGRTGTAARNARTDNMSHISPKTLERLGSKRNMCEGILDQCIAVRNFIWDDFLRDIAPNLRLAELNRESYMRQSCMRDISECITGRACQGLIGPDGNMDACLSNNGAVARATCRVVIDPCEQMEPQIWQYVLARLRALGTDRCIDEVRACFTRPFPLGCGEDFSACVGVDLRFMQDMCPPTLLPVCNQMFRQQGREFSVDDLDNILMGLYLNVDNIALENCQNVINTRMMELCGSTTDCDRFASNDTIGTGSLRMQKSGDIYRITGMISFGSILMGDSAGRVRVDRAEQGNIALGPGQIGIQEYIAEIRTRYGTRRGRVDTGAIISNIEEELNNIAGTINRTIDIIASDPHIQNCIGGRNLQNITGQDRQMTARFPNLLANTKMVIAASALRRAQDNYNNKFNEEVARATADASLDLAQYMCQKMATVGAEDLITTADNSTRLTEPFSIYYEIGSGLTTAQLMEGGTGRVETGGISWAANVSRRGARTHSVEGGGVTRTVNALFSRETRMCQICTMTVTENVRTTGSRSWFHNNRNVRTDVSIPVDECREFQM
jgi:hypothetical protein